MSNSDGSVSLLSLANRKFVTAEDGGKKPLIANRESNSQWEMFIMTPSPGIDLDEARNWWFFYFFIFEYLKLCLKTIPCEILIIFKM